MDYLVQPLDYFLECTHRILFLAQKNQMSKKSFILHDETLNTHGFRMLTGGADLSEFQKNPVMLLNHDDWALPIGRWENIRIEGTRILADPVFDLKDERGKQVASKVADDFMRMASIGAWPPIEVSDAPEHMLPGQKHGTVTRWLVREASIVTIGANHNALAMYDHDGNKIDLKDPSQVIKLFDTQKTIKTDMSKLNFLLKLADNATDQDRESAIQALLDSNAQMSDSIATLKTKMEAFETAEKGRKQAQSIALIDAAVKDGRINASAKEQFIKLFDADYDNASALLSGLPKRVGVAAQIENASDAEMSDFQKLPWDDLDKKGKLIVLRDKDPDLYAIKYEEKFGKKPEMK